MKNKEYNNQKQEIEALRHSCYEKAEKESIKIENNILLESKKQNVFFKEFYTNKEKLEQYRRLEVILSKEIFKDDKHCFREILTQYSNLPSNIREFLKECAKQIRILESGIIGEEKAYKAIKVLDDEIIILRNCHFKIDDLDCEHDLLLITTGGIFTVEVKWLSKDAEITETGMMIMPGGKGKTYKSNVAQQSQRHYHCIRRLLKNEGIDVPQIRHLIVMTNDRVVCKNNFPYIDVCYNTTLEHTLNNYLANKRMDFREMSFLRDKLLNHNLPERKYISTVDYSKDIIPLANAIKDAYCSSKIKTIDDEINSKLKELEEIKKADDEKGAAVVNAVFDTALLIREIFSDMF